MILESLFLGLLAWFLPLWYCLRPQPCALNLLSLYCGQSR